MPNTTFPTNRHGFDLHTVSDHGVGGLKFIFQVDPGTNLYRRGVPPLGDPVERMPLVSMGREVLFGDVVKERPKVEPCNDPREFQRRIGERDTMLSKLDSWFIWTYLLEHGDEDLAVLVAQLNHLQALPAASFDSMLEVGHLIAPSAVAEDGSTSRPRLPLPPFHEAFGGHNLLTFPDPEQQSSMAANAAIARANAEVALGSLKADPSQRVVDMAIQVEVPTHPGQHALLGEVLAPHIDDLHSFGITVEVDLATRVRVLVWDRKFYAVRVDMPEGIGRLSMDEIATAIRRV